jgi:hypothetical protein
LYILKDFYFVPTKEVCPRPTEPDGCIIHCR